MGCLSSSLRGSPPPMAGSKPPPQRPSSLRRIWRGVDSAHSNPLKAAEDGRGRAAAPAVPSRKASGLIKAKSGEYTPELAAALSELPPNAVADPQVRSGGMSLTG